MLHLKLRQQIMNHLEAGDKDSGLPLAQTLIQKFPKYSFNGLAYRSVISLDKIEQVQLHPGDCFSGSSNSIDQFFKDNRFDSYTADGIRGVVVEAEISGFDLNSFLKNESDLFPVADQEDIEVYLSENEVIALEIHKIIKQYDYKP